MLINVPVSLTPPGPTRPRMTSGDQQHESIQMPSRPQFPLLHSESKELGSRTSKVASGRCCHEDAAPKTKTPQGDRSSAACESVHPRPSPPRSSPLPLPRAAAGPPFPPRLRCAMGGGQQSELRGAKRSGRCHLIPSRRREAQRSERRALVPRAPAPSDLRRVSGQGLGGSSDHPPPGQRQSPPVSTAVADLGLEGGVDQRGSGNGGQESVWGPSAWRA